MLLELNNIFKNVIRLATKKKSKSKDYDKIASIYNNCSIIDKISKNAD